jgi:O-antigen/teichoic acid export membrane protein
LISLIKNILNPGESLKWRAMQGTVILVASEIYINGLRLAGNLILTRLLYPEAFGLMLIVNLVLIALDQFSDSGVRTAVIINSKGREQKYLNTAWVILGYRGVLLTILALISAWPISIIYDEPLLLGLICIASFNALISGFESPQQMISERDVQRFKLMLLDTIPQTLSLVIVITILWFYPSIWVLVMITLIASITKTFLSFLLFPSPNLSFKADKNIVLEIFKFGKWIFLATAMTFLATEGDKFIVSGFLTFAQLGVFSIAITLAKLVDMTSARLSLALLMPIYNEIEKEGFNIGKVIKIKISMYILLLPLVFLFAIFGQEIIDFLYDDRYVEAGWMLQVMALGGIFPVINNGYNAHILSKGESYHYCMQNMYRLIMSLLVVFLAGYYYGVVGIVYAVAAIPGITYLILYFHVRKFNIGTMKIDLLIFSIPLFLIILIWNYRGWPGLSV